MQKETIEDLYNYYRSSILFYYLEMHNHKTPELSSTPEDIPPTHTIYSFIKTQKTNNKK